MASLARLPTETLQRICQFLALINTQSLRNLCLANRALSQICSPLLIYRWGDSQECPEPPLERFVVHLSKYPELRKRVRSINIGYELAIGASDRPPVDLDADTLADLARAAASDIKLEPEYLASLCFDIKRGCRDALAVLLLAWCTRLTHLSITIPPFSVVEDEHCHLLTFAKQAILRLLADAAPGDLPLGEIRHVELHRCNNYHQVYFEIATIFFHLPKVKSLETSGLCDFAPIKEIWTRGLFVSFASDYSARYALSIPDSTSTIQELVLADNGLSGDALSILTLGIRGLKRLTIRVVSYKEQEDEPDCEEIAESLKACQDTLEELDLYIESHGHLRDPDTLRLDHDLLLVDMLLDVDVYGGFNCLRRLSCPMTHLFTATSEGYGYKFGMGLDRLPESIEYLRPRCPDLLACWDSKDKSVELCINSFINLLEEAGLEKRLCNLKVLDLSETFVDDLDSFGIGRLKHIAKSQGIELLLYDGVVKLSL
ncbi:hypothetical protein ACHAPU_002986 [Fusarium lateritium]